MLFKFVKHRCINLLNIGMRHGGRCVVYKHVPTKQVFFTAGLVVSVIVKSSHAFEEMFLSEATGVLHFFQQKK